MSAEAIISCQKCGRQYAVDPSLAGRLASCYACKSTFFICLAQTGLGEPVVSLTKPLEPHWVFFREGCGELVSKSAELLRLAGEPVTARSITRVVKTMPRSGRELTSGIWLEGYCFRTLEAAWKRSSYAPEGTQAREIMEYFMHDVPDLSDNTIAMLEGAVTGVLGVELEPATPEPVTRRRRWLGSWLNLARCHRTKGSGARGLLAAAK